MELHAQMGQTGETAGEKKGMSLLCERAQRKRFFFSPPSKCQNQFPISTLEEKMQRARIRENFAENLSSNSAVSSSAVQ